MLKENLKQIRYNYSLDEDIDLPLFDQLDMKMIDLFAQFVIREGRNR